MIGADVSQSSVVGSMVISQKLSKIVTMEHCYEVDIADSAAAADPLSDASRHGEHFGVSNTVSPFARSNCY